MWALFECAKRGEDLLSGTKRLNHFFWHSSIFSPECDRSNRWGKWEKVKREKAVAQSLSRTFWKSVKICVFLGA